MATYGGGNYSGGNLTLANGDYVYGEFSNVGTFTIPAGATVRVQPWNASSYGYVTVRAQEIIIQGTLSAYACGYGAGGGGGGTDGQRANGGATGTWAANGKGGAGSVGGKNGVDAWDRTSGAGGAGAGHAPGGGGPAKTSNNDLYGAHGYFGGYRGGQANGDSSTDTNIYMGSGGGGGSGGRSQNTSTSRPDKAAPGSGGGGAGTRGGGQIALYSSRIFQLTGRVETHAQTLTTGNGAIGGDMSGTAAGYGGNGGSATAGGTSSGGPERYNYWGGAAGGSGGGGAGGGILIYHSGYQPAQISGVLCSLGATGNRYKWAGSSVTAYYNGTMNFGSIKIFASAANTTGASFQGGWNNAYGSPLMRVGSSYVTPNARVGGD